MSSLAADIADALKTDLDAQSWPITLASYREYLVAIERSALGSENRVSIFPYSHTTTREGRNSISREHGIALVLRADADPTTSSEIDELVETLEDLADRYSVTQIDGATPTAVAMLLGDQLYDVDRLADSNLFQGGIIITYTTRK